MSILLNTLPLHHRGHLYNFLIDILMFELSFTIVLLCMALCTVEKGEILHHIGIVKHSLQCVAHLITLVNVYVDLVVFTRIAGTS